MSAKWARLCCVLLAVLLTIPPLEAAQVQISEADAEKPGQPEKKRPALLEVDYEHIESLGLYDIPVEGSLGRDLWSNTSRSAINFLLPKLEHPERSRVLHDMTFGVLLSEADPRLIENDVKIQPGLDLFTMRLNKLLEIGAYEHALKLYSLLEEEPYHPDLARAGILALMFNGEKSLACLEYKTMEDRKFEGIFWKDIAVYCAYALEGKKPDKTESNLISSVWLKKIVNAGADKFSYDGKKYSELSLFDQALLKSENILIFSEKHLNNPALIAPEHILLALKTEGLDDSQKYKLTAYAVQHGMISKQKWQKFYDEYTFKGAKNENGFIETDKIASWEKPLAHYANVKEARKDKDKWQIIHHALKNTPHTKLVTLLPFNEILRKLTPENTDSDIFAKAIKIFHINNSTLPERWAEKIKESVKDFESDDHIALYLITLLHQPDTLEESELKAPLSALGKSRNLKFKELSQIIIENLDKWNLKDHNAFKAYENDYALTSGENYVMPTLRVTDRLDLLGLNQSIGETVLLSTIMLRKHSLNEYYPSFTRRIIKVLKAVGLTRFSEDLLTEALLETI